MTFGVLNVCKEGGREGEIDIQTETENDCVYKYMHNIMHMMQGNVVHIAHVHSTCTCICD